jgi:hypothetical protein
MKYIVVGMENGAALRSAPSETGEQLGTLRFATLLNENAPSDSKWKNVTVVDGPLAGRTGHVSFVNLAEVHSEGAGRLVQAAAFFWEAFDRGKGKENDDGRGTVPRGPNYKQMVLDMWDALNGGRPPNDNTSHDDWPWSAAGMSAFVRKAGQGGGYQDFRFSNGHHAFIKHSVRMRESGNAAGPFWGFRLNEHRPRVGDLVVRWRGGVRTYDAVKTIMNTSTTFKSHTDVVCEIRSGFLWALGANNSNSVSRVKYLLDDDGFVKLTGDRFMIMKNVVP